MTVMKMQMKQHTTPPNYLTTFIRERHQELLQETRVVSSRRLLSLLELMELDQLKRKRVQQQDSS